MRTNIDAIQIWTAQKAPEFYRLLSHTSSELEWIAVIQPEAIADFGRVLCANGYQVGKNTSRQILSDGAWMFCGQLAKLP